MPESENVFSLKLTDVAGQSVRIYPRDIFAMTSQVAMLRVPSATQEMGKLLHDTHAKDFVTFDITDFDYSSNFSIEVSRRGTLKMKKASCYFPTFNHQGIRATQILAAYKPQESRDSEGQLRHTFASVTVLQNSEAIDAAIKSRTEDLHGNGEAYKKLYDDFWERYNADCQTRMRTLYAL